MIVVALTLCVAGACSFGSTNDSAASPESGAAARDSLPTPIQDGVWNNLSVEQARALASFPLAIPDPMPDSLEIITIMVSTSPPSGVQGKSNYAEVHIANAGGTSRIVLTETTRELHLNAGPSAIHSTLDINSTSIDKVADPRGGGKTTLSYSWNSDGVWYSLVALMPSANVTEAQLEQVLADIIESHATLANEWEGPV